MNCAYKTLTLELTACHLYAKLCFGRVLKRSLSAHWLQRSYFFTFNLNCGCMHFQSENDLNRCWIFGQFCFFKKPNLNRLSVFRRALLIRQWGVWVKKRQSLRLVSARLLSDCDNGSGVRRTDGDLTTVWGFSGMNSATISARITRIAPNVNGGPGIMPC